MSLIIARNEVPKVWCAIKRGAILPRFQVPAHKLKLWPDGRVEMMAGLSPKPTVVQLGRFQRPYVTQWLRHKRSLGLRCWREKEEVPHEVVAVVVLCHKSDEAEIRQRLEDARDRSELNHPEYYLVRD